MNKFILTIIINIIFFSVQGANLRARQLQNDDLDTIDSSEDIRVNPDIETDVIDEEKTHPDYPFIKLNKNYISYNGANWDKFYNKLLNASDNKISILHIGDSHLQADIATGKTRIMLQEKFVRSLQTSVFGKGLFTIMLFAARKATKKYGNISKQIP